MEGKPIYTLFPHPNTPAPPPPPSQYRPRRSRDNKRRASLDPLPPIEEPPHPPPPFEAELDEAPVLKPIHSLYNPQPARPTSARGTSSREERRKSLNRQISSSEDPALLLQQQLSIHNQQPRDPERTQTPSRSSSLKEKTRPTRQRTNTSESSERPSTAQDMRVSSPSLTLGARVLIPSPSSSSDSSLSKPPCLSPTSTVTPGKLVGDQTQYNKTPYFHGGIGGRGNYRKVKREDKRAPLAYAPNARPLNGRSKFLTNLFGRGGRRKGDLSDGDGPEGRGSEDKDSLNGSGGSSERAEVALGAAEVMRRKLLRQAGVRAY